MITDELKLDVDEVDIPVL